jgi:hypothetical protein
LSDVLVRGRVELYDGGILTDVDDDWPAEDSGIEILGHAWISDSTVVIRESLDDATITGSTVVLWSQDSRGCIALYDCVIHELDTSGYGDPDEAEDEPPFRLVIVDARSTVTGSVTGLSSSGALTRVHIGQSFVDGLVVSGCDLVLLNCWRDPAAVGPLVRVKAPGRVTVVAADLRIGGVRRVVDASDVAAELGVEVIERIVRPGRA